MIHAAACRFAQWTADLYGSPWACVLFGAATGVNASWFIAQPSTAS